MTRTNYTHWNEDHVFIYIDDFEMYFTLDDTTNSKMLALDDYIIECAQQMKDKTMQGYSSGKITEEGLFINVNMLDQPDGYESTIEFCGDFFCYMWRVPSHQELFNLSIQLKETAKEITDYLLDD